VTAGSFQVLAAAAKDAHGNLQIIVLDHATDTVWGGIQPLNPVAEWRDGEKLVPEDWPSVAGGKTASPSST
jgi:Protein of unknown function (DUF3732)